MQANLALARGAHLIIIGIGFIDEEQVCRSLSVVRSIDYVELVSFPDQHTIAKVPCLSVSVWG